MSDFGKIIAGLVVFIALVTFPFWYGAASGKAEAPNPKLTAEIQGKSCVMPKEYMRAYHMDLLDDWRDEAVREGLRVHVAHDGQIHDKSLTNTCLKCHSNQEEFCDACHNYLGVVPYCWDCHIDARRGN